MYQIKWIAGNGQEVVVEHITKIENIADHNVMMDTDEIRVTLGGKSKILQKIIDGNVMQMMDGKIRIPAEHVADVTAMINGAEDRAMAQEEKRQAVDAEYNAHYSAVQNKVNQ